MEHPQLANSKGYELRRVCPEFFPFRVHSHQQYGALNSQSYPIYLARIRMRVCNSDLISAGSRYLDSRYNVRVVEII